MTLQKIIEGQEWLPDLRQNPAAMTALRLAVSRLPRHVKQEIAQAAKAGGVDYWDLVGCNFSYEIAMLANSLHTLNAGSLVKGFSKLKVEPVGCTTFVSLRFDEDADLPDLADEVMFARNLDWNDSNGALRESFFVDTKQADSIPDRNYETVTFPGFSGCLTAHARGRFTIALNALMVDEDPVLLGEAPTMLLRRVMDSCATFEEAVEELTTSVLMVPALFTIAAGGFAPSLERALVIERSPTKCAVRGPVQVSDDSWVVAATNHSLLLESEELDGLTETACERYDTVMNGVRRRQVPATILADTEFGITIYRTLTSIGSHDVDRATQLEAW